MKKIIALLLAALMMFMLVSCGDDTNVRGEIGGNDATNSDAAASESTDSETDLELGSSSNNTYENKFLGIGCKLDSNWTFLSDAEIREANNLTQDLLDDELAEQLENASVIYDMQATKADSSANIVLNIEKIGSLSGALMSEEEYANSTLDGLKSGLESAGLSNIEASVTSVTFAGKEHAAIVVIGEAYGVKVYEKIVCFKKGKYVAAVAFASYNDDTTDEMLSYFYAL
ncbi:MAG: hypothetical protein IJO58_04005 [Clostridia bacterium]|nr:hypothetical protein [Clostridia bacterium]